MAIKMVREPSETPNINNIDDIVPMRYAYGNQNGYVIGKGTEISNTVNGLNFTVNSGRLVLQGVECDIDASGVTITIDNIATTRYYVVYLQVNLGLNTAQILDTYDTATYPTIDTGDDLTENTTGIARLPLYRFTATSGIISDVNKIVESVKYVNENLIKNTKVNNAVNADKSDTSTTSLYSLAPIKDLRTQNVYKTLTISSGDILLADNKTVPRIVNLFDNRTKGAIRSYSFSSKINKGDYILITLGFTSNISDTEAVYKIDTTSSRTYIFIIGYGVSSFVIGEFYYNSDDKSLTTLVASGTVSPENYIMTYKPLDMDNSGQLQFYPIIVRVDKILI